MKNAGHRIIGIIVCCCCLVTACTRPSEDEYAQSAYQEGKNLRQEDKPVEAMQAFIAAIQSGASDHALLGRTYSNMANMCRQAERHELAAEVYARSAVEFRLSGNPLTYAFALTNIAWEHAVMAHKDSAFILADSALTVCDSVPLYCKVAEAKAAACLYAAEYDSALFYSAGITDTLYRSMLRAQAFSFLDVNDSAMTYAQFVAEHTSNPRYLDDAYYIIAHADSAANTGEILKITSLRTDVQRQISDRKAELANAILLMTQSLNKPSETPLPIILWIILAVGLLALAALGTKHIFFTHKRKRLIQTCNLIHRSDNLSLYLHLDDYTSFCTICDKYFMGIAGKLQTRNFSPREIRICVLVLIGCTYSEIAELLYRAESGIGKDKYIIAKKLSTDAKGLQETLRTIACTD